MKTNILRNILWALATKWSAKLIGMVNTIVLARLLSPEDFGIIAMAVLVVAFLDATTQVGMHLYLFRHKDDDERIYNTTWTVSLIQGSLIAGLLLLLAPSIANFYDTPVLTEIVYCFAVIKVIEGLKNVGVLIAQKKLDFSVDFYVTMANRIAYLVFTIAFALWLESYWALVWGKLAATISGVVASYIFHAYRPRFALYDWPALLTYSQHTIPLSLGRYVNNNADSVVVGKFSSTAFLGGYHVMLNLASMFTRELLMPVMRGLVPNLAVMQHQPNFKEMYRLSLTTAVYAFLPLGVGMYFVDYEVVAILLGEKWLEYTPLLGWLSLYTMVAGITMFASEQVLVLMKREKLSNYLMWFRNLCVALALVWAVAHNDFYALPHALLVSSLVSLPIVMIVIARVFSTSLWFLMKTWGPALLAGGVMSGAILLVEPILTDNVVVALFLKVCVGAASYLLSIVLIYILRGLPANTPESLVGSKLPFVGQILHNRHAAE